MSKITKETCQQFREDFNTAMKNLEKKYGIQVQLGNMSYSDTNFTGKFEAKSIDASGKAAIDMRYEPSAKLALYCTDLSDEFQKEVQSRGVLGQNFVGQNGLTYTVIDFQPRKPKFCFILQDAAGNKTQCAAKFLKKYAK